MRESWITRLWQCRINAFICTLFQLEYFNREYVLIQVLHGLILVCPTFLTRQSIVLWLQLFVPYKHLMTKKQKKFNFLWEQALEWQLSSVSSVHVYWYYWCKNVHTSMKILDYHLVLLPLGTWEGTHRSTQGQKEQLDCTINTDWSTLSKDSLKSCNLDELVEDDVSFASTAVSSSSTRHIDLHVAKNSDKRLVPKSCAICLMNCNGPERICYSSNPDCIHAFHHDCNFHWMVSLDKLNTIEQH